MTKSERYEQFRADMEEAGCEVAYYQGRNFYEGPSVIIESEELQDAIRATSIRLQFDQMGKSGIIVYPK